MGATVCCITKTDGILLTSLDKKCAQKSSSKLKKTIEEEKEVWIPERLKFLCSEEILERVEEGMSVKKLIVSRIFSHREEIQYSTYFLKKIEKSLLKIQSFTKVNLKEGEINTMDLLKKAATLLESKIEAILAKKKEHERNKADRSKIRFFFVKAVDLYFSTQIISKKFKNQVQRTISPSKAKSRRIVDENYNDKKAPFESLTSLGTRSIAQTQHSKQISIAKFDITKSPRSSIDLGHAISFSSFNNQSPSQSRLYHEENIKLWIREEILDEILSLVVQKGRITEHHFVKMRHPEKQRITIIVSQVSSQTKIKKIQSMDEFQISSTSLQEFPFNK